MKLLLPLILFGIINSCASQNTNDILEISYEAHTRGSSVIIKVNSKEVFHQTYQSEKIEKTTTKDWEELIALGSKIELNKLHSFESAGQKRLVDAALHAQLKIKTNETEYVSSTFDHGNPPSEIATLVEKVFSLAGIRAED